MVWPQEKQIKISPFDLYEPTWQRETKPKRKSDAAAPRFDPLTCEAVKLIDPREGTNTQHGNRFQLPQGWFLISCTKFHGVSHLITMAFVIYQKCCRVTEPSKEREIVLDASAAALCSTLAR